MQKRRNGFTRSFAGENLVKHDGVELDSVELESTVLESTVLESAELGGKELGGKELGGKELDSVGYESARHKVAPQGSAQQRTPQQDAADQEQLQSEKTWPSKERKQKTESIESLSNAVLALLARRDYSRGELSERLQRRTDDINLIEAVLDMMAEKGYQSDERFCESYVRYRISQGKGPAKIRQELRLKQIEPYLIDLHLDKDPDFWREQAADVYFRKFKACQSLEPKEKAKRLRFMVSRGYPAQLIYPLIDGGSVY